MKNLICAIYLMICLTLYCGCSPVTPDSEILKESEIETTLEEQSGEVFTLRALYEAGKLSKEDLLNIAYHSNNAMYNKELIGEDFSPTVDNTLTPELESNLKETIANFYRTRKINPWENASAERFKIEGYYGFYNGYHILKYDNGTDGIYLDSTITIVDIGGVKFGFKLTYNNTHIDGVSLTLNNSVVEIYNLYLAENIGLHIKEHDDFESLKNFLTLYHSGFKVFYPLLNNFNGVEISHQKHTVRYYYESETYPDFSQSSDFSNITTSFTITDPSLAPYTDSAQLRVMINTHISSLNYSFIPTQKDIIYSKYKYVGELYPEYNYVVVVYRILPNDLHYEFLKIYYQANNDIPLEYFENLFSPDKFEWIVIE